MWTAIPQSACFIINTFIALIAATVEQRQRTQYIDSLRAGRFKPRWGEVFDIGTDRFWGPHNLLHDGYQGFFPAVNWPGRGGDHLLQSSAEVKEKVELYSLSVS
jgi:hypothetical protein